MPKKKKDKIKAKQMEDSEEEDKIAKSAPKNEEEQVEAAWNKNIVRLSLVKNNDE